MKLMLISNDFEIAQYAVSCGVDRIFLDLEIHGKQKRQANRDTVISGHQITDIEPIRKATDISGAELLVRLNPMYENTKIEVEQAISAGADILMLPMFETADQLRRFLDLVDGRVKVIPLVETPKAVTNFREIRSVEGVAEFYFGLNDLHIGLGMKFMFELLIDGTIERMAAFCHGRSIASIEPPRTRIDDEAGASRLLRDVGCLRPRLRDGQSSSQQSSPNSCHASSISPHASSSPSPHASSSSPSHSSYSAHSSSSSSQSASSSAKAPSP